MDSSLNLHLAGVGEVETARIASLLAAGNQKYGQAWRVDTDASADLMIVDLAQFAGRVERVHAIELGKRFVVLADADGDTLGAELVLRRPYGGYQLRTLLDSVAMTIHRARVGQNLPPANDVSPSLAGAALKRIPETIGSAAAIAATSARASFDQPRGERVCTNLEALLQRGPVVIARPAIAELILDPLKGVYYTTAKLSELEPYFLDPVAPDDCRPFLAARLAAVRARMTAQPLQRLRWLRAFLASDGWLALHLDPGGNYQIERWISMDGDYKVPYAIARSMLRPMALHEIAAQSKATMAEVFNLVNAYDAIGMLICLPRRARHAAPAEHVGGHAVNPTSSDRIGTRPSDRLLAALAMPR